MFVKIFSHSGCLRSLSGKHKCYFYSCLETPFNNFSACSVRFCMISSQESISFYHCRRLACHHTSICHISVHNRFSKPPQRQKLQFFKRNPRLFFFQVYFCHLIAKRTNRMPSASSGDSGINISGFYNTVFIVFVNLCFLWMPTNLVPICTPSAPSMNAAAIPRPSAIPPAAMTGTFTASTT